MPFCPEHDPEEKELRRLTREAAERRLERLRALVASAGPLTRLRCLELLVIERKVTITDVEAVLKAYHCAG